jgi:hypothetical protein
VFKSWKQPPAKMQGKIAYIRSKVVRPFSGPAQAGAICIGLPFLLGIHSLKENNDLNHLYKKSSSLIKLSTSWT